MKKETASKPVKATAKQTTSKTVKAAAKQATSKSAQAIAKQKNKVDVTSIIGMQKNNSAKPLTKYLPDPTKDYAHSFNWHLSEVIDENWAFQNNVFTAEECRRIIETMKSSKSSSPLSYSHTGDNLVATESAEDAFTRTSKVRISPVSWIRSDIEENRWIWRRITDAVNGVNNQFFKYDLTEIQSLQFTTYDSEEKGFYGKHIDMMYRSTGTRKLSLSIQLSEPEDYSGGDLLLHTGEEPLVLPKSQGIGIFFPSYTLHEVKPVTKGIRYSLVAWFLGPQFK